MRDGALAEQGTHETLLAAGGVYTELYNLQVPPAEQELFEVPGGALASLYRPE